MRFVIALVLSVLVWAAPAAATGIHQSFAQEHPLQGLFLGGEELPLFEGGVPGLLLSAADALDSIAKEIGESEAAGLLGDAADTLRGLASEFDSWIAPSFADALADSAPEIAEVSASLSGSSSEEPLLLVPLSGSLGESPVPEPATLLLLAGGLLGLAARRPRVR